MKPRTRLLAAATAAFIGMAAAPAHAIQIQPDITKLKYEPIGHFKPGQALPPANGYNVGPTSAFFKEEYKDGIFNPSGNFNAYDTNVFETLALPFRGAGDEFGDDPLGNGTNGGDPDHGQCSGDPRSNRPRGGSSGYPTIAGECFNHQLEYVEYYERTMMSILGKFGAFTKRYEFFNPSDPGGDPNQLPFLGRGNTFGGRAINPAVIVPGTEKAEETIVIGAHYDKTNDGPAATWDSQEGHAQMIRVAKLMADYWDAQNARPTATIKFIPWDGEESGTLGSEDYANNVIPPGDEEFKVRGYWNTDPCAAGYPAFRFGNRADRVQLGIQLANPFRSKDPLTGPASTVLVTPADLPAKYHARINEFNKNAPRYVEEVFQHLDDKLITQEPDQPEIFVAQGGGESSATKPSDIGRDVTIGRARPFLFSSDWRNFEDRGIPFFNPGPEITGPSSFADPGNPDALVILHSPFDNLQLLNQYAGAPEGGHAEGWIKGMEMCAQMLSWGMLQPDQGGASAEEVDKLTAYYEALPNEAGIDEPVHFDASGSHVQLAEGTSTEGLTYAWDFGDGTTGTGKDPYHRYDREGTFQSKLTVTDPRTGKTATMSLPIVVLPVPTTPLPIPALTAPASDEDGTFDLGYSLRDTPSTLSGWQILESADFQRLLADDLEGPVDARWNASRPTHPDISPWQESDSSTRKFRGNQKVSGAQSYWSGVAPERFTPGTIQKGESILTLKEPFEVPRGAGAALSYNTLFQNESDDRGFVQVAEARDGELAWETVDQLGGGDLDICNPADPGNALLAGFRQRGADLTSYAGKKILVRFVLSLGPDNRAASQPCGWYVDDVDVSAGTFRPIDRSALIADKGQFFEGSYSVRDRQKGVYAYRVRGLYPPSSEYEGPASNIRVVEVTRGAGPGSGRNADPGNRPGGESGDGQPACTAAAGFRSAGVRPKGRSLRFSFTTLANSPTIVEVFRTSRGSRVLREQRVARFTGRRAGFTWNGRSSRRVTDGTYFVRYTTGAPSSRDVRRVTLVRSKGRFRVVRPHHRRDTCDVLRTFKLSSPAFGGRTRKSLGIAFRLLERARVTVTVQRGEKVVRRFEASDRKALTTHRLRLAARGLRRGEYRVTVTAVTPGRTATATLTSRKL